MKIALINYYLRLSDYHTRYALATMRLGEYISSNGVEVELLPISINEKNLDDFVVKELKDKYDIVGISNYVWSKDITPKLARAIRENAPEISIIIGGPEVQYTDLTQYEKELFILGEGEDSLLKTIQYLERGRKDIDFFKNNCNVFDKDHPEREMAKERLVYKNPLFTKFKVIDKDFLYYETSRGCLYNCGYCGFKNRDNVELFDLDFVEEEIRRIGNIGFKEVFVIDANLGGTPERAKKILSMFAKYAPQSKLTIYLRPEFIDNEMIELLEKSNLKEVRIGIQTINEHIHKWIRNNSIKHVLEELPKLSKHQIPWKAEFIIGLPGDTMEGLKKSLEFAANVLKPTEICCYPLTLIKDTPLYKLVNSEGPEWIKIDDNSRAYESSSYTHEELLDMHKYAQMMMNKYMEQMKSWSEAERRNKITRNKKSIHRDME